MTTIKADKSLLILLIAATVVVLFPALGAVPLMHDESAVCELARRFSASDISCVFERHGEDSSTNFYAYIVSVIMNIWPGLPATFAVRLPSAVIIMLLTLGMFVFRGKEEKLSRVFLASLLFMSSYLVSALAYHASTISMMAFFFIFSLSALYHWVKMPTANKMYLLVVTTAAASIFMGLAAPIAIIVLGVGFLALQDSRRKVARYAILFVLAVMASALAYFFLMFVTNDPMVAQNVLGFEQIMRPLTDYSRFEIFLRHIVFSIFPWSIPILVALFWIAFNPSWIRTKFLSLSLLRQFGIFLFLLTLPTLFVINNLSLVMVLAAIFFNMTTISNFLLSQIHNHSITWRITGGIFAALIAAFTAVYVIVVSRNAGFSIGYLDIHVACFPAWSAWSILLVVLIIANLYSLWRSQRTINFNNRYLYHIVILYILTQLLYKGFINPYLNISFY